MCSAVVSVVLHLLYKHAIGVVVILVHLLACERHLLVCQFVSLNRHNSSLVVKSAFFLALYYRAAGLHPCHGLLCPVAAISILVVVLHLVCAVVEGIEVSALVVRHVAVFSSAVVGGYLHLCYQRLLDSIVSLGFGTCGLSLRHNPNARSCGDEHTDAWCGLSHSAQTCQQGYAC